MMVGAALTFQLVLGQPQRQWAAGFTIRQGMANLPPRTPWADSFML
jgi:hypothetical protein